MTYLDRLIVRKGGSYYPMGTVTKDELMGKNRTRAWDFFLKNKDSYGWAL